MAEKTLKTRLIQKHDTEANWNLATNFYPMKGEIIVYDIDETHDYERMKIGDGVKLPVDLPFVDDAKVDKVEGKGLSSNDFTNSEKNKLANIAEGANKTVVDDALSATSTNPVQNKVVKAALDNKSDVGHAHSDLYYDRSEIDDVTDYIQTQLDEKADKTEIPDIGEITNDEINEICNTIVYSTDEVIL